MGSMNTRLTITRGDTKRFDLTVTDELTGAAIDLTGATMWFTVKRSRSEPDSVKQFQKTTSDGITIASGSSGTATLIIAPADSASMDPARLYVWDLQIKSSTGAIYTVDSGPLAVLGDVTRATS